MSRMKRSLTLTPRQILIMLHDVLATAGAIVLTFVMRFEEPQLSDKLVALPYLPLFMAYAAVVYFAFGMHRNKWRFTSLPDLYNIFRVSHGPGRHAARRRLRAGGAQRVW